MGNCFLVQLSCDTLITRCWDCTSRQLLAVSKLKDALEHLQTASGELRAMELEVTTKVSNKEGPHMRPRQQVQVWLSRVHNKLNEADQLIENGAREVKNLCLGGHCSKNCKSTFKLVKKVDKLLKDVVDLKRDGRFKDVVEKAPPNPVIQKPSEQTVGLESMCSELWSLVMDKNIGVVGIYGMGGVGKTTLLTKINNKFQRTQHDFDVVIWVVVPRELTLEKVQEEIAKRIGLLKNDEGWKEKNFGEKAEDILYVLQRKKFALLLDDIWESVELTRVGVPLSELQNGSKVVFTTRSEAVCQQMDAHKSIKVTPLSWEDAWSLFLKKVGEDILKVNPAITHLAQDVARECDGLPIALITVARAMACKTTPEEWKHALEILRNLKDTEVDEMVQNVEKKVFTPLKFSYDSLPNGKVRSCFLYCSLFPEDYKIMKKELISYWIYEKFCDRTEGYNILGTLSRVGLLESEEEHVKMHDVIRDTALWIASKCNKDDEGKFFVKAGTEAVEFPEDEKWEGVSRMSLMKNSLQNICKAPKCSRLSTLFLSHNPSLNIVKGEFFQFMHSLAVLDLSYTGLCELPSSICHLTSLRYLNLSRTCIEELPPEFSKLVSLRYLNLSHTYIKELPKEISEFVSLEYLNLSFTVIKELPVELKALPKLQILNLDYTPMKPPMLGEIGSVTAAVCVIM